MGFKPEGYTSVSPYLIVTDAERMLAFLESAFGAERLRIVPRESGAGLAHAEARVGDSVVMMGEMPAAGAAHVHVYVPDAETAFARAADAGGTVVQDIRSDGDGDRRGGITGPDGIVWWIATQEIEQP